MRQTHSEPRTAAATASPRILAVADWSVDPNHVARELRGRAADGAAFGLLVPSRLSSLQWIGDPHASRPCAERQLATIRELSPGVEIGFSEVGDPERVPAVAETLERWPADGIVLFERPRSLLRLGRWSVAARLERRTGIRVERVQVTSESRRTAPWPRRAPRCICV